jgi:hypothetical protein
MRLRRVGLVEGDIRAVVQPCGTVPFRRVRQTACPSLGMDGRC